ncbi:MAG: polysaccharide biosynthesis/export family protein [Pseudomonadota bacterium]
MLRVFVTLLAVIAATGAWAQANYRIAPGDILDVSVLEDPTLNKNVLVRPDGGISLLVVGNIRAGGRTVPELERLIANGLSSQFAVRPTVSVSLLQLAVPEPELEEQEELIDVYFLGEVATPGLRQLKEGTTILQALAQAGGLGRFAAQKRIQVRRFDSDGSEQLFTFNYRDIVNGSRQVSGFRVLEGDVILVPERRLFE